MSTSTAIRRMIDAGLTFDQALLAVDVCEVELGPAKGKSSAAIRQQRYRDRKSAGEGITRDVTLSTSITRDENHNDVTPEAALRVVYTKPSSKVDIKPSTLPSEATPLAAKPNGFARFWEAYPNKTGKGAAERAFAKALKNCGGHDPPGQFIAAIARAREGRKWREGYVPNPATWLNERRWEDEIQPSELRPSHERPDAKQSAKEANLARALGGAHAAARYGNG